MIERLKHRWNINNNFQVLVILIVFAVTGTSTLYVKRVIFELIGFSDFASLWLKIPLYIIVIFPVYQVLFLIVAFIFGQFKFAWNFEKKVFSRFIPKKK
jgi:hypothetical protein